MDFYMFNDRDIVMSTNRNDFSMFLWGYLQGRFETHITCKIQKMGADDFFLIKDNGGEYHVYRFSVHSPIVQNTKTGLEIKDVLEIVAGVRPKTTQTGDDAIKQAAIILRDHCKNKGVFCSGCPFEMDEDDKMSGYDCCKLLAHSPELWEV